MQSVRFCARVTLPPSPGTSPPSRLVRVHVPSDMVCFHCHLSVILVCTVHPVSLELLAPLAGTLSAKFSQSGLVPGLVLSGVQGTSVATMSFARAMEALKAAGRPLTLSFTEEAPPRPGEEAAPVVDEADELFKLIDKDRSGTISFVEFVRSPSLESCLRFIPSLGVF